MQLIINFSRPGKGITRYIEGLVDENRVRIKTRNHIAPEFSRKWCEEVWWHNDCVLPGILIDSVMKYLFFNQWFSIMQLIGIKNDLLGYYVDVHTPIRKIDEEYYLTDLFLDLWIAPDGKCRELDRDEFEQGYQEGLITTYQYKKACQIFTKLKREVTTGKFYRRID
jgi:Protein of unknown function (DUF402)